MTPCAHWLASIAIVAASSLASAAPLPIPDPGYGGNGDGIARIAVTGVPADGGEAARAIVQADGRLVLIGTTQKAQPDQPHPEYQTVLARIEADGRLDTSFGPNHDGLVRTAYFGVAADVAQAADGKLVYAGHGSPSYAMLVGRLNADGSPDTGFFLSGRRLIAPSVLVDGATAGEITNLVPLSDGKVLVLGSAAILDTPVRGFACALRLSADGTTDSSFGDAGRTCLAPAPPSPPLSQAGAGLVLDDGRILIAGAAQHSGGSGWDMSVIRLGANGALDTSFGSAGNGWTFIGFDQGGAMVDSAQAIAVDREGRILVAGYFQGPFGDDIGVARLLPDGQPDPSFGFHGRVQVGIDLGGFNGERAHNIVALGDGRILVGATADGQYSSFGVALLFKSDGQLDARFGEDGIFFQSWPGAAVETILMGRGQILAGDHIYMVGSAVDTAHTRYDFAATRTVMPLFANGFEH